jgi:hypothetical protein
MLTRVALVAAAAGALGLCAVPARAGAPVSNNCNKAGQCVYAGGCPMPFGDDGGNTTCNKSAEGCEAAIGKGVGKAVGAVIKCHIKQAQAAFKNASKPTSFDEETCENTAINAFVTAANAAKAKDATGACNCVDVNAIAGLIGGVLDQLNYLTACEGLVTPTPAPSVCQAPAVSVTTGSPGDTDDTGCVDPTDKAGSAAAQGAGKCVAKMVATWIKCHGTFAKNVLKNKVDPADPNNTDEICEGDGDNSNPKGAVEAFNACLQKLQAKGLPPCVMNNVPNILAATKTNLDGANGLLYCASPSGAFVQ